jgi:hypothetical protein
MELKMRRRVAWVACSLLVVAVAGILVLNVRGQFLWGKFSRWAKAGAERKTELINQELENLKNHPWAGKYYYGDGLGVNVNLSLAPKSGFVFMWNGCLGLYDLNYGGVGEADGRIRLVFKYPNDRKGFQGIAPELIPIVWGQRHYLIPADGIIDFANAINAGFEPTTTLRGSFLLRAGDELKAVHGQPNIPSEYSDYLLRHPIKAEISAIKGSRIRDSARITTVVLNVGSARGVKQGMEFHVYSPSTIFESARITSVESSNSEARIVQYEVDEKCRRPSIDWKFSTFAGRE